MENKYSKVSVLDVRAQSAHIKIGSVGIVRNDFSLLSTVDILLTSTGFNRVQLLPGNKYQIKRDHQNKMRIVLHEKEWDDEIEDTLICYFVPRQ